MQQQKVVLDEDDVRRTLVRIAHEIVEKHAGRPVALVGIHRRGAHLASRLHRLVCDLLEAEVPLGDIDIAFYRDDLAPARSSRVSTPPTSTSRSTATPSCSSTTSSSPAAPPARASRPCSTTAAPSASSSPCSPTAATASCRSAPTTSARTCRPRAASASTSGSPRSTASTRSPSPSLEGGDRVRHLLSIEDLDRAAIERILDRANSFTEVSEREIKKVPALRGRRVLNLFYEASTRTRSLFELAAKSLSADVINFAAGGSSVEKGESLKDTVQTLSRLPARPDRHPHAARRRRRAGRRLDDGRASSTPATASTSTRRRRCSTSTRCASGSARSTAATSGSSATSCTRASRARTSSPSPSSARRSRCAARRP